jgi:hypothetical protein
MGALNGQVGVLPNLYQRSSSLFLMGNRGLQLRTPSYIVWETSSERLKSAAIIDHGQNSNRG